MRGVEYMCDKCAHDGAWRSTHELENNGCRQKEEKQQPLFMHVMLVLIKRQVIKKVTLFLHFYAVYKDCKFM